MEEEGALVPPNQADRMEYTAKGNVLEQNEFTTMHTIWNYV